MMLDRAHAEKLFSQLQTTERSDVGPLDTRSVTVERVEGHPHLYIIYIVTDYDDSDVGEGVIPVTALYKSWDKKGFNGHTNSLVYVHWFDN